ncbi:MAG: recombinase family protein [Ktedonobacteraceae bacterium]
MVQMIATLAEFERDVISERAQAGLEAAGARGRRGGRSKATRELRPEQLERATERYAASNTTVAEIMHPHQL